MTAAVFVQHFCPADAREWSFQRLRLLNLIVRGRVHAIQLSSNCRSLLYFKADGERPVCKDTAPDIFLSRMEHFPKDKESLTFCRRPCDVDRLFIFIFFALFRTKRRVLAVHRQQIVSTTTAATIKMESHCVRRNSAELCLFPVDLSEGSSAAELTES